MVDPTFRDHGCVDQGKPMGWFISPYIIRPAISCGGYVRGGGRFTSHEVSS